MALKKQEVPLNILLADDDPDDCFFVDKALTEIPISSQLTTVRDGEQLMKYLANNPKNLPDILFLDLSMPRKTGFECLSEIKDNPKLKNILVVVLTTSFARGIDFEESLKNTLVMIGAEEYIRKPLDNVQLKKLIHKALIRALEIKALDQPEASSTIELV